MSSKQRYRLRNPATGARSCSRPSRARSTGPRLGRAARGRRQGAAARALDLAPAVGGGEPALLPLVRAARPEGSQRLPHLRQAHGAARLAGGRRVERVARSSLRSRCSAGGDARRHAAVAAASRTRSRRARPTSPRRTTRAPKRPPRRRPRPRRPRRKPRRAQRRKRDQRIGRKRSEHGTGKRRQLAAAPAPKKPSASGGAAASEEAADEATGRRRHHGRRQRADHSQHPRARPVAPPASATGAGTRRPRTPPLRPLARYGVEISVAL